MTMEYGLCHQITFNVTTDIAVGGHLNTLEILLSVDADNYVDVVEGNYLDVGIAVQIYHDDEVEIGEWMYLAPGFSHMIALTESRSRVSLSGGTALLQKLTTYGTPPCYDIHHLRFFNYSYSRNLCATECYISQFVSNCGCLPFIVGKIRMCEAEEVFECVKKTPPPADIRAQLKMCSHICKEKCNKNEFNTFITSTKFPNPAQVRRKAFNEFLGLRNGLSYENASRDLILLNIYYKDTTTKVTELYEAMTLIDALNSSGGALSLCAGISVLTLIQAVVYFASAINSAICHGYSRLFRIVRRETSMRSTMDLLRTSDSGLSNPEKSDFNDNSSTHVARF
ncbi:hypothetical protein AB6A40_005044 [Gnathostoma spinigerum]|uniref:Amiloride-sensitive sodium channel n=1 Tax=Gnathostoma spinigerum TaxID=75299 RepID=A0ABD6EEA5_9BILA